MPVLSCHDWVVRSKKAITFCAIALSGWLLLATTGLAADDAIPAETQQAFTKQVQPVLKKYCLNCHSGAKPKADLALDKYRDWAGALKDRHIWEEVLENVRTHAMPPDGKPQPTAAERDTIVKFIDTELERADQSRRGPGRVTMRRLNRTEYNYTVRDLLGVDFQPADDFPADDVGYGFDNIGDVLSLPPLLMEKYLAAAERIATTAVVSREASKPTTKGWNSNELESTLGKSHGGSLNSTGECFHEVEFPAEGKYTFRIRAWGDLAGKDPPRMELRLDKDVIRKFDVYNTRRSPKVYEVTATVKPGQHRVAVAFLNDFYEKGEGDKKPKDRNLWVDRIEVDFPVSLEPGLLPESHRRVVFCQPEGGNHEACARKIVERLSSRAFRRPATKDEIERLLGLYRLARKEGDSFERGIQLVVQAVLVSPHFLFRAEVERTAQADGSYALNDYEIASRLSYFLWSSMPDDDLLVLAAAGKLHDRAALTAQTRRMLQDPKSRALVENFSGQWLQTRNLDVVTPATLTFPKYRESLSDAMRSETELFFAAVLRENRSILEFIDADYTFLNEELASLYGIEGVSGDKFRRVKLDDPNRGGVITQASVLTVTSNPTRTSPVKRGKWILENILGAPPPPPPPDVPDLNDRDRKLTGATMRKRLEQHRADPGCASCHSRMDPLGFGLENFDAIGGWRAKEGKADIDATGTLPDGNSFNGPRELKAVLKARHEEFTQCLTEKLLTYALGRGLEYTDKYTVDAIARTVTANNYKFTTLLVEIVNSEPFLKRHRAGAQK